MLNELQILNGIFILVIFIFLWLVTQPYLDKYLNKKKEQQPKELNLNLPPIPLILKRPEKILKPTKIINKCSLCNGLGELLYNQKGEKLSYPILCPICGVQNET